MLQKIRELICMGANMDYFPKKDKEYEKISILICKKSKEKTELNINTLKSLFDHWGKGSRDLSETTKNAVSDFLGFDDWDDLINNIDEIYNISRKYNRIIRRRNVSILETNENYTEIKSLDKGKEFIVRYTPDREIRLKVLGNDRYKVLSTVNSDLRNGDEITIKSFLLGFEFAAFDIWRQGKNLGHYIAASGHVISEVRICKK